MTNEELKALRERLEEEATCLLDQGNQYAALMSRTQANDYWERAADINAAARCVRALEVAQEALADIASVGDSFCNEHDDVNCITCIHKMAVDALAAIEAAAEVKS
jgi:hypothetical protein